MVSFNKNIKAVRSLAMAFLDLFKIYPLMKKGFLTNKYTLSVFILLAILATDILLHKGMSRVILPKSFTSKREPQTGLAKCDNSLQVNGKIWLKAVNSAAKAKGIDSTIDGFEMDIYFDAAKNCFFVYHDSSAISATVADEIFAVAEQRKMNASIWLDFKNLGENNKAAALQQLLLLRRKYGLAGRILVESSDPASLRSFCDSGFFTSYYVPYFNPYTEDEHTLTGRIDSIASTLKKYPTSALSGYYFQLPFLKKFFPVFPLLTWTDDSKISLVNRVFNYQLEKDKDVLIILHNVEN